METQTKTPVDIIQELIAIHSTRKEAVEKLSTQEISEEDHKAMESAKAQSDQFITALMNELSSFGDAVQDSPDRENEYQQIWKSSLGNSNNNAKEIFGQLEKALKQTYETVVATKELPESLVQILNSQKEQLQLS